MKLTTDFFKSRNACAEWLIYFEATFGFEADYQVVLDRLAKENRVSLAHWLLKTVGPIDETLELSGDTKIEGHLFVAGHLHCSANISVSLSIEAGSGIEAGEDFGIYCGLSVCLSMKANYAVLIAKDRPKNLLLGEYRQLSGCKL